MIQVHTYHSSNANPPWIGFPVLPNGKQLLIHFIGNSEAEVIENATSFYEAEKQRQLAIAGKSVGEIVDELKAAPVSGRGQGFADKVWVLNRTIGHRGRIDAAQWPAYEANGYIKAGPRSK